MKPGHLPDKEPQKLLTGADDLYIWRCYDFLEKCENSMAKLPLPWVMLRRAVE